MTFQAETQAKNVSIELGPREERQEIHAGHAGLIKDWQGMTPVFFASSSGVVEVMLQFEGLEFISAHDDPLLWKCAQLGIVTGKIADALREQLGRRNRRMLPIEKGQIQFWVSFDILNVVQD